MLALFDKEALLNPFLPGTPSKILLANTADPDQMPRLIRVYSDCVMFLKRQYAN